MLSSYMHILPPEEYINIKYNIYKYKPPEVLYICYDLGHKCTARSHAAGKRGCVNVRSTKAAGLQLCSSR